MQDRLIKQAACHMWSSGNPTESVTQRQAPLIYLKGWRCEIQTWVTFSLFSLSGSLVPLMSPFSLNFHLASDKSMWSLWFHYLHSCLLSRIRGCIAIFVNMVLQTDFKKATRETDIAFKRKGKTVVESCENIGKIYIFCTYSSKFKCMRTYTF